MPPTVETTLSAVEFFAVQVRALHSQRGWFYMTDTNTTQTGTSAGAPAIPFDQISELEQQAALCSLAMNEKDGILDGSEVAWGGAPRSIDEQKALLAAHHDKAVAIMEAVLASPKGRDVLPIAWPPAMAPATASAAAPVITEEEPATKSATSEDAENGSGSQAPAPGLVLTKEQHAASKSLGDKIDEAIHALGGSVAADWRELRKLLGHIL